jgi:tRNA (guanine37-N1)-methyltransferase
MWSVDVITIFPEMVDLPLRTGLLGKAREKGLIDLTLIDLRDYTHDRHRSVDDSPYGGGAGMVMKPEPLVDAIEAADAARGRSHRVILTPTGRPLDQARVRALAELPRLLLVCGRYEGIDARVSSYVDEELSLGDIVLSGGEPAAVCLIDAIGRLLPGVLGRIESTVEESFSELLLEYPQYTRPPEFRGAAVPAVLVSGDHERVRRWRRRQSLLRTRERRPDLFARLGLSDEDRALLDEPEPD